ncbi:hypothetical protein OEZ86_010257 [Tetradesmus obliquus]|nr:hypothetical protein OEZ86_010257 [Tetradesmus obliquus]
MLRVPLAASPSILEQGYGAVQGARNWDTIAQKLSKQGANIQVAVFGSSLTQGYHKGSGFAETWAHEVQRWLQAAFPSSNVDLINLARDATDVIPAATCWYQRVPADADLVIVDYSLGGCGNMLCAGVGSELVASYETLLRRLMRNAPNAALLLLENFFFLDMAGPGQPATPLPYYQTGGDMHWLLARRYRIPMVSVRDALYDVMFNDTALQAAVGVTREQMMADAMHPNAHGHPINGPDDG